MERSFRYRQASMPHNRPQTVIVAFPPRQSPLSITNTASQRGTCVSKEPSPHELHPRPIARLQSLLVVQLQAFPLANGSLHGKRLNPELRHLVCQVSFVSRTLSLRAQANAGKGAGAGAARARMDVERRSDQGASDVEPAPQRTASLHDTVVVQCVQL